MDDKQTLLSYLNRNRDGLLSALDGLDEVEARQPMTPTATNLLGLVKHVANVEYGYLGQLWGRPLTHPLVVTDGEFERDPLTDMWATADQPMTEVMAFARLVARHSSELVDITPLTATTRVPWWPESEQPVTLQRLLVHLVAELARHAGHADILRESLDVAAGREPAARDRLPDGLTWELHLDRVEQAAHAAAADGTR